MKTLSIVLVSCLAATIHCMVATNFNKEISDVAIALSEIINGLKPSSLTILSPPHSRQPGECYDSNIEHMESCHKHVDDFIYQLHKLYFKSVIFYDVELFFQYVESNLQGSIETFNLIFCKPYELSARIHDRKLSHRLSLFIFYWGAKYPPKSNEVRFEEPIRAAVITRPRKKAFRIYYNQAVPDGDSNLRLVNWYDADNLGLQKIPLLPSAASVYSNFNGRVFRVPVFHSPPWFWVNYNNETSNSTIFEIMDNDFDPDIEIPSVIDDCTEVNVSGGRDHRLLNLLAQHMNFQYVYIEAPSRTQGSMRLEKEANESFTGGIGLLQNGFADFLLGDVSLSWERRKAVEFSFFTLADSGAFATHAPRRLNEALAIIRPFKRDVWPYLLLTIVLSGPIFYAIIAIPYKWNLRDDRNPREDDAEEGTFFHMVYIREITINNEATRRLARLQWAQYLAEHKNLQEMPKDLLDRCIWFTVQLFLKQSCKELYHGYRAKFLMIVYWIAATYVLADVYSAQLTSQFARPAHESPINTLQRLQNAMLRDGYQLYVEKESSSLEMLENGTEIFRNLFALMKQQNMDDDDGYLIDSVEAGLKLIADGFENKAVLGGRETLYFNIQQFGSKSFQLSQKLYTRYSAVAVQIGCPFLDSLNDVLIHLFEGGILDKMTSAEYETQSRIIAVDYNEKQGQHSSQTPATGAATGTDAASSSNDDSSGGQDNSNGKSSASSSETAPKNVDVIQPLNLRMLQGAFIVLVFGHSMAAIVLLLEHIMHRLQLNFLKLCQINFRAHYKLACRSILRVMHIFIRRIQY